MTRIFGMSQKTFWQLVVIGLALWRFIKLGLDVTLLFRLTSYELIAFSVVVIFIDEFAPLIWICCMTRR